MQITFPQELILAMGISAASFAGSTLIKSNKQQKSVDIQAKGASPDALKQTRDNAKTDQSQANTSSQTATAERIGLESEVANATTPDEKTMVEVRVKAAKLKEADAALCFQLADTKFKAADKSYNEALEEYKQSTTEANGVLHKNSDVSQASWVDIFRGDEIGHFKLIDMGKVQLGFFTVIVILTYASSVNVSVLHAGKEFLVISTKSAFLPSTPA